MAIVNITRIQHRRGDRADLPTPLASGEIGWAIDTQQLFIGNGSLAEGAPYVGNTEILTEHSDLSAMFGYGGSSSGNFTFTGNGIGVASGVTRTVDNKLNDIVSVRDFGADGNGVECSGAFNQALAELFRIGDQQTRIVLYVPAGEYIINAALELPPNTILVGDGMGNTVIRTNSSVPLIRTVDAHGDSGVAMGTVSTTLPNNILIHNITFKSTAGANMTELRSTTNLMLDRVEFLGSYTNIADDVTNAGQVGLKFISPGSASASGKITATGCRFSQLGRGFEQTALLYDISFDRCLFDTCWIGINLDIIDPDLMDPVMVQNCYFHNISREAIYASNTTKFTSIGNRFVNVGNQGTGIAVYPVLTSEGAGSVSWMDRFDRLPSELTAGNKNRVNLTSTSASQTLAYADPEDRFRWGLKETLRTYRYSLGGGTSGSLTSIAVTADPGYNGNTGFQEVRYVATRGTNTRSGTIRLSVSAADVDIVDDYNYTGTDCGLDFTASIDGSNVVTIDYTVTAGATPVILVVSATNLLVE